MSDDNTNIANCRKYIQLLGACSANIEASINMIMDRYDYLCWDPCVDVSDIELRPIKRACDYILADLNDVKGIYRQLNDWLKKAQE